MNGESRPFSLVLFDAPTGNQGAKKTPGPAPMPSSAGDCANRGNETPASAGHQHPAGHVGELGEHLPALARCRWPASLFRGIASRASTDRHQPPSRPHRRAVEILASAGTLQPGRSAGPADPVAFFLVLACRPRSGHQRRPRRRAGRVPDPPLKNEKIAPSRRAETDPFGHAQRPRWVARLSDGGGTLHGGMRWLPASLFSIFAP